MIITNSRYALVGYFITSYPMRAHGIIVIYLCFHSILLSPLLHSHLYLVFTLSLFSPLIQPLDVYFLLLNFDQKDKTQLLAQL